jgi:hypothetical protein
MTTNELKKLLAATDEVIGAIESGDLVRGPVNWADLSCCQVSWVVTDDGSEYAEVLIEEASPEAVEFRETVRCELVRRGWPGVQVVTEW